MKTATIIVTSDSTFAASNPTMKRGTMFEIFSTDSPAVVAAKFKSAAKLLEAGAQVHVQCRDRRAASVMDWTDLKAFAREVLEGARSAPAPEPMTPEWTPADFHDLEDADARGRAALLREGWILCVGGGRHGWETRRNYSAQPPAEQVWDTDLYVAEALGFITKQDIQDLPPVTSVHFVGRALALVRRPGAFLFMDGV